MAYANARGSFLDSIPTITKNLIIINVLMWVATLALQSRGIYLEKWLGLHYWQASDFMPWQVVSYMFMHDSSSISGGLLHLGCNMFNIYMFGSLLERMLGAKRFIIYFFTCGIGAAVVQELVWHFTWMSDFAANLRTASGAIPSVAEVQQSIAAADPTVLGFMREFLNLHITVGASGAVFGLLLAFGMSFPNLKMFIIPFPFPIKAKWMVIGYGVFELFCGTQGMMSGVAHFAHLGGMLFGIFLILYWKRTGVIRTNEYI
ncbi:MAG: rhomboid family intramembrane serine protease [Bacteroidales bacterium]|nr:rhomboid family intramembrane serine protease [Bacteroidales bacterium]